MTVDLQPTSVGESLLLRPLREDDWSPLYRVASDPAIWALHPAHDRHEEPLFRAYFANALSSGGALVAIERASGALIGGSRFSSERAEPREIEIGWTFLARSHWGRATNREMKRLMLTHAFGFVDAAIFLIGERNSRSRRAMEKIGGRLTSRRLSAVVAGRDVSHRVYRVSRDDFADSPLVLKAV